MADDFRGTALPLDRTGLDDALAIVDVGAAELWAIIGVETTGCGFLPDRRPKILFERHVFSRLTNGAHDAAHADVSNPVPGGYGVSGAPQYDRLAIAVGLDRAAALRSASWGIGQVMGFNAAAAGFAGVELLVAASAASEAAQVRAMVSFLEANALDRPLRAHDWPGFARGYNGPAYAANSYDTRLAAAFQKCLHGGLPDLVVRAAQIHLLYLGFEPGAIDGVMGRFTRAAMNEFQVARKLPTTDAVDDATADALRAAVGAL